MHVDECYQLGYVIKKHGLNGEVNILLDVDFPDEYQNLESVFVEINQKLVPFFIEHITLKGNKAVVKLEEVDTIEQAQELKNKSLYLPLNTLPELDGDQFYYHQVMDYMVVDKTTGEVGRINSVLNGPQQDLFVVDKDGKEVLIPVNDELIVKVNHNNKVIEFDLPEGLIDVYLE